jgi:hypothetical protein
MSQPSPASGRRPRPDFTLIELLVVEEENMVSHPGRRIGHSPRVLPRRAGAVLGVLALVLTGTAACAQEAAWEKRLARDLPLMGHRNWIVIADAAYPLQSGTGIVTIDTGEDQLQVAQAVLAALAKSRHVRPVVYLDAELPFVPEKDAPGIKAYRDRLKALLKGRAVTALPHEDVIAKLDEAGKTFRVLILKTNLTLPYTSVFIQLDCGYWSPEAEKRLREAINQSGR